MEIVPPRSKICIHAFVSDTGGCGAVRMLHPAFYLTNYHANEYGFHFTWSKDFIRDVNFYERYTFVVFQRPANPEHHRWIQWYKANVSLLTGVPCVADVDDLYFEVPKYNYASQFFDTWRPHAEHVLGMVDGLAVSTEVIKGELKRYNRNISVLANHLPKYMWGEPRFRGKETDRVKILYPCSANHFATADLVQKGITGGDIGPTLLEYIRNTVDKYEWCLVGHYPRELVDLVDNGKITIPNWRPPYSYPAFMKHYGADIGIAPLVANRFNEAKSNIKMLEYTAAGIPGVYVDLEPYQQASLRAVDDEEFIEKIEWLAESRENRQTTWERDHEVLRPHLFYEEYDNGLKHVNGYMSLFGKQLVVEEPLRKPQGYPGGYENSLKEGAKMAAAYCGDAQSVALFNVKGLNLAMALLEMKPSIMHVIDDGIPKGIEFLYDQVQEGTKLMFHQGEFEAPIDTMVIDCLELTTEKLKTLLDIYGDIPRHQIVLANTMYSDRFDAVIEGFVDSVEDLYLKKVYDFWGGVSIIVRSTEPVATVRTKTNHPLIPGGYTLVPQCELEVIRPGEKDAIQEPTATEVHGCREVDARGENPTEG